MSVRIATRSDEPELLRLLGLMHSEGGLLPLDIQEARGTFDHAFSRRGGIIGAIGSSDHLEAIIGLRISRFWYTKENHLEELFNFVDPNHRRSDHAKTLIEFAKKCADQIGIPLFIGVLTNSRMAPKVRLYQTRLGEPSGAYFVYNSSWDKIDKPTKADFWSAFESRAERRAREKICRSIPIATQTAMMA